jgi:hypothetical protein
MLEYIDKEHLYLYDGIIIPSVSELLKKVFPNKYKDVPKNILNNKAEYGSKVHKIIELKEKGKEYKNLIDSVIIEESINQYNKIKRNNLIQVLKQEEMVCYKGLYAGRFDMIALVNGEYCLCDIKTTAVLDKEYLSWQLSLYELAYGVKFEKLYAIWLPKKGLGKLVEIERKSLKEMEKVIYEI